MATKQRNLDNRLLLSTARYLAGIFAIGLLLLTPIIINQRNQLAQENAGRNLKILNDTITNARNVIKHDFAGKVSSAKFTKDLAERLSADQPDLVIRIVSDNPLNASDFPAAGEAAILEEFRRNKDPKAQKSGTIRIVGNEYLYTAGPEVVVKACLSCHGDINKAPVAQRIRFNTPSGYNWVEGDIVGAHIYAAKIEPAQTIILESLQYALAIGAAMLLILIASIYSIQRHLLNDIQNMDRITGGIAEGNEGIISADIKSRRQDTIGRMFRNLNVIRKAIAMNLRDEDNE